MTEQPNTATIRAEFSARWYEGHTLITVHALCDALDAARAERDEWIEWANRAEWVNLRRRCERAEARAEAAEENLAFAQQRAADNGLRAEIGEEKITRLVGEVRALKSLIEGAKAERCEGPMCECCDMILSALTEDSQ